jgi:hypothetical protein
VTEISDHSILHGLDGHDVARRSAQHLFGFFAYRFDFIGRLVHRDDRRLIDHDAFTFRVNQGVRRAQIDGQVTGEHAEQGAHVMRTGILIAVNRHFQIASLSIACPPGVRSTKLRCLPSA